MEVDVDPGTGEIAVNGRNVWTNVPLVPAQADLADLRTAIADGQPQLATVLVALQPFARYARAMLDHEIPRHVQDDPSTPVLSAGGGDAPAEVWVRDFQIAAAMSRAIDQILEDSN